MGQGHAPVTRSLHACMIDVVATCSVPFAQTHRLKCSDKRICAVGKLIQLIYAIIRAVCTWQLVGSMPASGMVWSGLPCCALPRPSTALRGHDAADCKQEEAVAHRGSSHHQESGRSLAGDLAGGTCLHRETWGTRAPLGSEVSARAQAT